MRPGFTLWSACWILLWINDATANKAEEQIYRLMPNDTPEEHINRLMPNISALLQSSNFSSPGENVYIGFAFKPFERSFKVPHEFAQKNSSEDVDTNEIAPATRFKRGVVNLYNMIDCATGCNPLAYSSYGCYCGLFGTGRAVDGIDRCCKLHDYCYYTTKCNQFSVYFVPYLWKCFRGRPLCGFSTYDDSDWTMFKSCARMLCECDRQFAECLAEYRCPRSRKICLTSTVRLLQNLLVP